MRYFYCSVLVVTSMVILVTGYKKYTALQSIIFTNIDKPEVLKESEKESNAGRGYPLDGVAASALVSRQELLEKVHSEYFYGKCATRYKTLVLRDHLTYEDIKGKIIVRGYLNTSQVITCIYVRSQSPLADMVKYRPSRFTMCLSKIRYHYLGRQFIYHFYEWFLPVEMRAGIDWDLFFYHG